MGRAMNPLYELLEGIGEFERDYCPTQYPEIFQNRFRDLMYAAYQAGIEVAIKASKK